MQDEKSCTVYFTHFLKPQTINGGSLKGTVKFLAQLFPIISSSFPNLEFPKLIELSDEVMTKQ